MAIIAPNTDVYLLRNVPLNNDYENTFYFNSATEQFNYFYPKRAYTKVNYTFQRNNGMLRVDVPAESAMQCNYLMYRNTNFGNKWFYAFINNVHYVNNEMSEIEFELDVIQTWLFDFMTVTDGIGTIDNCFIARQHATRDRIGDNLVPEPVQNGEYVYNGNFNILDPHFDNMPDTDYGRKIRKMTEYIIIVGYADNDDDKVYVNSLTYGLSGLKVAFFYSFSQGLRNLLTAASAAGQPDAIKSLSYAPRSTVFPYIKDLLPNNTDNEIELILRTAGVFVDTDLDNVGVESFFLPTIHYTTVTIPNIVGNETLDGYLPANKKLYTYPYNCLVLSDGTGENKIYQYELFTDSSNGITFKWYGNVVPPIETYLLPDNYKNISTNNTMDKFIVSNYAQGSWTNDAYQAWLAQNSMGLTSGLLNSGLSAITSFGGGVLNNDLLSNVLNAQRDDFIWRGKMGQKSSFVPIENTKRNIGMSDYNYNMGGASSAISGVTSALSAIQHAKAQTDILGGNPNSNGLQDLGFKTLSYNRMSLRNQFARRVDQFFTLYGYAQNIVGKPVLNARSRFTYIKTIGCDVHPNIPTFYLQQICRLFDNGIRFWVDKTNFQNYVLANAPIYT